MLQNKIQHDISVSTCSKWVNKSAICEADSETTKHTGNAILHKWRMHLAIDSEKIFNLAHILKSKCVFFLLSLECHERSVGTKLCLLCINSWACTFYISRTTKVSASSAHKIFLCTQPLLLNMKMDQLQLLYFRSSVHTNQESYIPNLPALEVCVQSTVLLSQSHTIKVL